MLPPGNYPRAENHGLDWQEARRRLLAGEPVRINQLICQPQVVESQVVVGLANVKAGDDGSVQADAHLRDLKEVTGYRVMIDDVLNSRLLLSTSDVAEALLLLMSCWDNAEDRGQISDWCPRPLR